MSEKRLRPSNGPADGLPSRNLGLPARNVGPSDASLIVSAGTRKERLRQRAWNARNLHKSHRPYAELRVASAFSFLDGSSLPEDLVEQSARLGLPAVALVDRNGVYGAPRFFKAANAAGIKALVGAEVILDFGFSISDSRPRRASSIQNPKSKIQNRITLLVENRAGYKNLCRLITEGAAGKPKGETSVTIEQVAAHAAGLHCLTGGEEGPLARALWRGGLDAGRETLDRLARIFPGRLHVEMGRHRLREEEHGNQARAELARRMNLPLVATNGAHYARAKDKELHDVLTSIRHHTTLDAAGDLLAAQRERHLKDAAAMSELFADLPQALDAAWELSQRLDFTLADLGYRFPDYPLPPGETPDSYLRQVTWNGARTRFKPLTARAQAQIGKELAMIEKLSLAGYFLIVWD
ncbi:MAG TPA: PHP domain-containing protein, partial [Thermoanaerobaculia bacterium]|nr:PHP domain-containing protein [Thermoanaerobaculia bacterium]